MFNPELFAYCEQHTSEEDPILKYIERETHAKVLMSRMRSGKLEGKALEMFSKMMCPELLLERGNYTGYAAICLAKGVAPQGRLITLGINGGREERLRDFF